MEIFGSTTFAVFNIADACVVVGTILLLIFILFFDETFKDKKPIEESANVNRELNTDVDNNDENDLVVSDIQNQTKEKKE